MKIIIARKMRYTRLICMDGGCKEYSHNVKGKVSESILLSVTGIGDDCSGIICREAVWM
jgi:hypothetical protein